MIKNEILSLLLQDLPESLIITFVCFYLLNLTLEWKNVLVIAFLQTMTNLIRLFPIAFGMHTLILTITLVLYIRFITKTKTSKIFIAVITCFLALIISQGIYLKPLLAYFNLDYKEAISDPVIKSFINIPGYLSLLVIPALKKVYLFIRLKKHIF